MRIRKETTLHGHTITERMMWDWLTTAFEGGSNYWIESVTVNAALRKLQDLFHSDFDSTESGWRWYHQVPFVLRDSSSKGHELEMDTASGKFYLNIVRMINGIQLMSESQTQHFDDLISENYDAITADIFLQYSLFGEVVFG
tara:strand:- start:649 stop:1074 length:426 start_codon:yes stop_codon:yes gene_type:complete